MALPEFDRTKDGNLYGWIRRQAQRVRDSRQAAAIQRQRDAADRQARELAAMHAADAEMGLLDDGKRGERQVIVKVAIEK